MQNSRATDNNNASTRNNTQPPEDRVSAMLNDGKEFVETLAGAASGAKSMLAGFCDWMRLGDEEFRAKLAAEKLAAEQVAAEQIAAEQIAAEQVVAEQIAAEQVAAEQAKDAEYTAITADDPRNAEPDWVTVEAYADAVNTAMSQTAAHQHKPNGP